MNGSNAPITQPENIAAANQIQITQMIQADGTHLIRGARSIEGMPLIDSIAV